MLIRSAVPLSLRQVLMVPTQIPEETIWRGVEVELENSEILAVQGGMVETQVAEVSIF
jgi:hypothetical protein